MAAGTPTLAAPHIPVWSRQAVGKSHQLGRSSRPFHSFDPSKPAKQFVTSADEGITHRRALPYPPYPLRSRRSCRPAFSSAANTQPAPNHLTTEARDVHKFL